MKSHDRAPLLGRPTPSAGVLVLMPIALIVIVAVLDILAPPYVHLGPLLVAAPALTASFAGSGLTAAVAGLAIAAQLLISQIRGSITDSNHISQTVALIAVSAVVVLFCRVREHRNVELAQVRTVSDAAQQVLRRPPPSRMGPLRLAYAYQAAADEARIGGDFYAVVRTPDGTRLLIGDVRGKGLEGIEDAALILGAFRSSAHHNPDLPTLAAHLDGALTWDIAASDEDADENFATALLIDIPDGHPRASVLNCGHPQPLVLHDGRTTAWGSRPAPPLGLGWLSPKGGTVQSFPFAPGDTLLLYTDGVIEARAPNGTFYPLAQRVCQWNEQRSPDRLIAHILKDLTAHTGGALNDDAALLAVQRLPVNGPVGAENVER